MRHNKRCRHRQHQRNEAKLQHASQNTHANLDIEQEAHNMRGARCVVRGAIFDSTRQCNH